MQDPQLDEALAELASGRSVLMFPEGTRSVDGKMQDFKSGAGYLALRGGCDVLPIHISGTHEVLGKGSLIPRRNPVEVRIGRAQWKRLAARRAEFQGGSVEPTPGFEPGPFLTKNALCQQAPQTPILISISPLPDTIRV